jgi:anti-anti-sigma factor
MMPKPIALEGEQTIYQARETQHLLHTALHAADGLLLDLSQVQENDSSLLQILLWIQSEGRRLDKPVQLLSPSDSVQKTVQILGLHASFPSDFGASI